MDVIVGPLNISFVLTAIIFSERANFAESSAIYGFQTVDGGVGFVGMIVDHRQYARMALILIDKSLLMHERRATIA